MWLLIINAYSLWGLKYLCWRLYAGGEIQLTDAIDALIAQETVEAFHMSGRSHDCGDKLGYLKAIVEYSMRHESLGGEFTEHLKSLVN